MSPADAIALSRDCVLLVALGVSLFTDLTRGKVYDWCTFPAIGLGFLIAYVAGAVETAQGNALVDSIGGFALALGIFGVAYLLSMLGGGDVKLMCAVGAIKGVSFFIDAAVLTACAGAVIAVAVLVWRGRLPEGLKSSALALFAPRKFRERRKSAPEGAAEMMTIPYVAAIVFGACAALFLSWL